MTLSVPKPNKSTRLHTLLPQSHKKPKATAEKQPIRSSLSSPQVVENIPIHLFRKPKNQPRIMKITLLLSIVTIVSARRMAPIPSNNVHRMGKSNRFNLMNLVPHQNSCNNLDGRSMCRKSRFSLFFLFVLCILHHCSHYFRMGSRRRRILFGAPRGYNVPRCKRRKGYESRKVSQTGCE